MNVWCWGHDKLPGKKHGEKKLLAYFSCSLWIRFWGNLKVVHAIIKALHRKEAVISRSDLNRRRKIKSDNTKDKGTSMTL